MLVLSRKVKEVLVINHAIRVTVVEIAPGKVRLGIDCPRDVEVDRLEVAERKRERERDAEAA